jgi:hypothetical protein
LYQGGIIKETEFIDRETLLGNGSLGALLKENSKNKTLLVIHSFNFKTMNNSFNFKTIHVFTLTAFE